MKKQDRPQSSKRTAGQKKPKGAAVEAVIFGVVQGVGFRPFIYRLAKTFHYKGWVKNVGHGVKIHLESEEFTNFHNFFYVLKKNKPPLSQLEDINIKTAPYLSLKDFSIKKSNLGESFVFISPDISICAKCQEEMMKPTDRRFRYPFINCTDCGPRYTIVKALPYDRNQTTMANFKMCKECNAEYINPNNRRYHAQPIACPVCGPHVILKKSGSGKEIKGGIANARSLIKKGEILAVKGLGGFHLVCDALNNRAVSRLRNIKTRQTKPFALMARNLLIVKKYAYVNSAEESQLLSAQRPIVLLQKKDDVQGIAPFLNELGFMLPYTPLHYLLLKDIDIIVATSSNKKDSPLMKEEEEGIEKLCDYILTHNRPIQMRADDSVMKIVHDTPLFIRRARGYVPYPQKVPTALESPHHILALGGELKDTISIYKNGYVVTSQFLGDLDDYQNYQYFEETVRHLMGLFKIKPDVVVSDLHPDFHSTRFAAKLGLPHIKVQHHFAHILAPLLEHKISPQDKVLGISFDGYGYGSDGTAWGGEFLLADYLTCLRYAHFKYVPLPGGDLASKQPWRMALSYLVDTYGRDFPQIKAMEGIKKSNIQGVIEMINQKINSPLTSSCGRLFDAISFLVGISPLEVEYEAEAPMRLESVAEKELEESYEFSVRHCKTSFPSYEISFACMIESIVRDLQHKIRVPVISAKFHNTLAQLIAALAEKAKEEHGIENVVISGGVFLNRKLLHKTCDLLRKKGFKITRPTLYSPNDESISLGQIAHALIKMKTGKE